MSGNHNVLVEDENGLSKIVGRSAIVQIFPDYGQFENMEQAKDFVEVALRLNPEATLMSDLYEECQTDMDCADGYVCIDHKCEMITPNANPPW